MSRTTTVNRKGELTAHALQQGHVQVRGWMTVGMSQRSVTLGWTYGYEEGFESAYYILYKEQRCDGNSSSELHVEGLIDQAREKFIAVVAEKRGL